MYRYIFSLVLLLFTFICGAQSVLPSKTELMKKNLPELIKLLEQDKKKSAITNEESTHESGIIISNGLPPTKRASLPSLSKYNNVTINSEKSNSEVSDDKAKIDDSSNPTPIKMEYVKKSLVAIQKKMEQQSQSKVK